MALFHHHTLHVALCGLATVVAFKFIFTGFNAGPGASGFAAHLGHEWVILCNLFLLLVLGWHPNERHKPVRGNTGVATSVAQGPAGGSAAAGL